MTAVEWVFDKMLDVAAGNSSLTTQEILEKSNEMFEEQILSAYMTAKLKHVDCLGIDVMKRKVIRGGSWKDIGYFIQTGTRSFEFQDTAKSYIGFRCVMSYLGRGKTVDPEDYNEE